MMIFLLAAIMFAFLTGCAAQPCKPDNQEAVVPAKLRLDANSETEHMIDAYDPLEAFNRRMYNFNYYSTFGIGFKRSRTCSLTSRHTAARHR
jgi:ABC-type transporter lipoprotein component MlaA